MANSAIKITTMKYVKLNSEKTQNVTEGIQKHANTLKQTNVDTKNTVHFFNQRTIIQIPMKILKRRLKS